MLIYGREIILDWMNLTYKLVWKEAEELKDYIKACTVPVHKERGNKNEWDNQRGISMSSVHGKMHTVIES